MAAATNIGIRLRRFVFYIAESSFDLWHGVETRGIFFHDESVAQGDPVFAHAKHYGGTYPRSFRRYVRALGIDYARYSFVDLGSGKGKALLLAAEYPFRRIIGIELFEPWAQAARRNLVCAKRFAKPPPATWKWCSAMLQRSIIHPSLSSSISTTRLTRSS